MLYFLYLNNHLLFFRKPSFQFFFIFLLELCLVLPFFSIPVNVEKWTNSTVRRMANFCWTKLLLVFSGCLLLRGRASQSYPFDQMAECVIQQENKTYFLINISGKPHSHNLLWTLKYIILVFEMPPMPIIYHLNKSNSE